MAVTPASVPPPSTAARRPYNFGGGMAIFPPSVLEQARADILQYGDTGQSIFELSHRSDAFRGILDEATANLRRLLDMPDNYHVLFLQGGATLQFSMLPMNFLRGSGRPADYLVTGHWSRKAVKEAYREGQVRVVWDGADNDYRRLPEPSELHFDKDAAYVFYVSNETTQGLQFQAPLEVGNVPLFCDMSADFITGPLDVGRFGAIIAHSQKNVGLAGSTIAIIRDDLLERIPADLHTMLDYRLHVDSGSVLNTAPVFPIYSIVLMTRWLMDEVGGLAAMRELVERRSALLYDVIDNSPLYRLHPEPAYRSRINLVFDLPTPELTQRFIDAAAAQGLIGLHGHRSRGGIRVSLYNPMPMAGVRLLRDFMLDFQETVARTSGLANSRLP